MPEFDDALQPAHYRPQLDYNPMAGIERYTVLLKDGETTATIYPIQNTERLPPGLLAFLCDEFNIEVERGDTFAFFDPLHLDAFQNYWFGAFAGVMVLGDAPTLVGPKHWEKECLGTFFVKPNYPGRASHICTAGFLVNAGIRGKGIGRTLADCFLSWAPRLGYTYCMFNLVFETNVAARSIWESLSFKRVGRIKSAGILKGHDTAVDALIYGRELVAHSDATLGAYRFDKIKYYLETGKYPAMADRQEKSRLRSSASHYRVEYGKLMLRDKEVVSDPVRQLQICAETHHASHGGINKTTSAVAEKYHWTRIKDTVAAAIKNCVVCRESVNEHGMAHETGHGLNQNLSQNSRNTGANQSLRNGSSGQSLRTISKKSTPMSAPTVDTEPDADADMSLLGHDLANLDDGLIAAVEAAQKRQKTHHNQSHDHHQSHHDEHDEHGLHSSPHVSEPQSYAAVAAAAVGGHQKYPYYGADFPHHPFTNKYTPSKRDARDSVPVDPDVSAYDHAVGHGGDEIEIARALMQSTEVENEQQTSRQKRPHDDGHDVDDADGDDADEANMFLRND